MKQFIHFQFEAQQVASLKMEALLAAFDTTQCRPGIASLLRLGGHPIPPSR